MPADKLLATTMVACWLVSMPLSAAEILTRGENFSVDVSPLDGRLAIDLAGDIWTLPAYGGEATLICDEELPLGRPRWSPDGQRILYQSTGPDGTSIWIRDLGGDAPRKVGPDNVYQQDASWHPQGERIVYSAQTNDAGLDLWETDLPTGLAWRLTSDPGDELEPVWSANGRNLAWISRSGSHYALMLRRRGEPAVVLVEADVPLSSPSWRPDGSLLTFLRHDDGGATLSMAILSEPVLVRDVDSAEDFFTAPVAWRDRLHMVYTAAGSIRSRGFEDRRSRLVPFRATVNPERAPPPKPVIRRELTVTNAPAERLIIRGARLFDGIWPGYRGGYDVVIEAGRVVAVDPRRDRDDGTILDLGDITVMPGLIDAWSSLDSSPRRGAALLAYGVTTVATGEGKLDFDPVTWEGEEQPGPRVLQMAASLPPNGVRSLADATTPGMAALLASRQAVALGQTTPPGRRFATPPGLAGAPGNSAAGSAENRMPPGLGLHAELCALVAAGLTGEQALHAAGRNAAAALGIENQAGTIVPGAVADLVLVAGDPLEDVSDALNIVAVVRNGRFFSLVSLLEKAIDTATVE